MLMNNLYFGLDEIQLHKCFRFCVDCKWGQHILAIASDKWNKWQLHEGEIEELKMSQITSSII